ncbi:hypothetical protein WKW47_00680 [Staphylococcus nepalensis]|nr:hypothetical protein [Staphylococcus nepalensis]
MQYKEIKNVDIFTIFNSYISDIEKELLGNNAKIIYLNRYIYNRTDIFIETLDNIERFINNIKQIEAQNKDKIAKYNFDTLQGTLSNIRENTRIKLNTCGKRGKEYKISPVKISNLRNLFGAEFWSICCKNFSFVS